MAHMVWLFVPDDMSKWPAVDKDDPVMRRDLASLKVPGYEDAALPAAQGHEHHHGGSSAPAGSSDHNGHAGQVAPDAHEGHTTP